MTRTIGIVLGTYAIIAVVVALFQLVMKLEDGLVAGQAFTSALPAELTRRTLARRPPEAPPGLPWMSLT